MPNRVFNIETNSFIQRRLELKRKNIAFVFQVNCPGCFSHGIPLFNELFKNFSKSTGFIGISTAFEDFEFNTEIHTKLLLETGQCVGETLKYLKTTFESDKYPEKLLFPVVFDRLLKAEEFLNEKNILAILSNFEQFIMVDDFEKIRLIERVRLQYIGQQFIPSTFTLSQLQGTPSFIIFDDTYTIMQTYFGAQSYKTLADKLK